MYMRTNSEKEIIPTFMILLHEDEYNGYEINYSRTLAGGHIVQGVGFALYRPPASLSFHSSIVLLKQMHTF